MKLLTLITLLTGTLFNTGYASTLPAGKFMLSTDFSFTSARELWKGNSEEVSFQDAGGETHADGTTKDAKTRYYNLGFLFAYGLPLWGLQADLRLDYTASKILEASHPNVAQGGEDAEVNQLSGVTVKLTKAFINDPSFSFSAYLAFKHPVEDDPEAPSFIAVNDFSTHYSAGLKASYSITSNFFGYLDAKYTARSTADSLEEEELPADQITTKADFLYAYDRKLSFGFGGLWQHTFSGPDISTDAFGAANMKSGVASFFAARERFVAYTYYFNYYLQENSWVGISHLKKFWGRNTDRSQTYTVFLGKTF